MGRSSAWTQRSAGSNSISGRKRQPAPPREAAFHINSIYLHPIIIRVFSSRSVMELGLSPPVPSPPPHYWMSLDGFNKLFCADLQLQ